ncbi:unnamed protein product [Sphagnum balticum]
MRVGTEDELQEKLVQIQTKWVGTQLRAVQYVLSWMQYKTYFVGAYVDKVPHFESSSSSRVEGAHSTLKQRLQVSSVVLIKIHLQFTIAKEHAGRKVRPQPDPRFETIMGLPLGTTIYNLHAANQSLPMSAVHKQWWLALDLQVGTPAIQIFEPVVACVRGRPSVAAVAARATSR